MKQKLIYTKVNKLFEDILIKKGIDIDDLYIPKKYSNCKSIRKINKLIARNIKSRRSELKYFADVAGCWSFFYVTSLDKFINTPRSLQKKLNNFSTGS